MEAAFGYKTCPRCGEKLFDDMATCYGCLYRFEGERASVLVEALTEAAPGPEPAPGAEPEPELAPEPDLVPEPEPGIYDVDEPDYLYGEEPLGPAPRESAPASAWAVRVKTALSDTLLPVADLGLIVGRAADCDVVLHQRSVSDKHLRLTPAPDGVEFQDLGSTNPALYGEEPICDAVLVLPGTTVELCGTILEVERAP